MGLKKIRRLVYLAPVALHSPAQRPHHFVLWAQQALGCHVIWIDPNPSRLPHWSDWRRLKTQNLKALGPSWAQDGWLTQLKLRALPLEPFAVGRLANQWLQRRQLHAIKALLSQEDCWLVIGRPSALALQLCQGSEADRVLYDVMDNTPAFSSGKASSWMRHMHRNLSHLAGHIWCSASKLHEQLRTASGREAVLVRNGSDLRPVPRQGAATPPWILGYVGTIASWFDWTWIVKLATSVPQVELRLYGPLMTSVPRDLPSNVLCFSAVRQEDVATLMGQWHAGLIPFKKNNLTASVDPVKYYEYRSTGLPVLSTRFGDMKQHSSDDGLWFLEDLSLPSVPDRLGQWWCRPISERVKVGTTWHENFNEGARAIGWLSA
jgi:hypothetical protein